MKSGFVMCGFVLTLEYYDAAFRDIEAESNVATPLLRNTFGSDHFRPTRKQWSSLCLYQAKMELHHAY